MKETNPCSTTVAVSFSVYYLHFDFASCTFFFFLLCRILRFIKYNYPSFILHLWVVSEAHCSGGPSRGALPLHAGAAPPPGPFRPQAEAGDTPGARPGARSSKGQ